VVVADVCQGRCRSEVATDDPSPVGLPLRSEPRHTAVEAAVMTEAASAQCQWCDKPFRARRGGSPQRFCGAKCRMMFWSALRRWGERALAAGFLTAADIKNGDPTACTLLLGATSPAPVAEATPQSPSSAASRADSRFTRQQNLEQLMAQAIAMRRRG
jgi:hypothetical protein